MTYCYYYVLFKRYFSSYFLVSSVMFLLFDFLPLNVYYKTYSDLRKFPLPITEIVLHICVWSLIIEELRQVRRRKDKLF